MEECLLAVSEAAEAMEGAAAMARLEEAATALVDVVDMDPHRMEGVGMDLEVEATVVVLR